MRLLMHWKTFPSGCNRENGWDVIEYTLLLAFFAVVIIAVLMLFHQVWSLAALKIAAIWDLIARSDASLTVLAIVVGTLLVCLAMRRKAHHP